MRQLVLFILSSLLVICILRDIKELILDGDGILCLAARQDVARTHDKGYQWLLLAESKTEILNGNEYNYRPAKAQNRMEMILSYEQSEIATESGP